MILEKINHVIIKTINDINCQLNDEEFEELQQIVYEHFDFEISTEIETKGLVEAIKKFITELTWIKPNRPTYYDYMDLFTKNIIQSGFENVFNDPKGEELSSNFISNSYFNGFLNSVENDATTFIADEMPKYESEVVTLC